MIGGEGEGKRGEGEIKAKERRTDYSTDVPYWGLFGFNHKVFEVVVLMLLECSEQKVQDCFSVSPCSLPLLLLLLLVFVLFIETTQVSLCELHGMGALTYSLCEAVGLYTDAGVFAKACAVNLVFSADAIWCLKYVTDHFIGNFHLSFLIALLLLLPHP